MEKESELRNYGRKRGKKGVKKRMNNIMEGYGCCFLHWEYKQGKEGVTRPGDEKHGVKT